MSQLHLVALGSSFAAGPGIRPVINRAAGRSSRNYSHLLADKLGARLTDLSVSGATLANVLCDRQSAFLSSFAPQLDGLPADADIVTLTAGGNDLGYALGMILDSAKAVTGPFQRLMGIGEAQPVEAASIAAVTDRLGSIVDRVTSIAPKAKVYLVTYLGVFGDASRTGQGLPLSAIQIEHYADMATQLAQATLDAHLQHPLTELVPMHVVSKGHEVGSSQPWVDGFSISMFFAGRVAYHPNEAGHAAVAEELYKRIKARE